MAARAKHPKQTGAHGDKSRRRRKKPPSDLIDFYQRWSEFRDIAVGVVKRSEISKAQRNAVHWLILLADRIAERDIV
jgi:hypothetical protein